ncbi:MAG: hypothetical protein ACRDTZ_03650 [Pseudonocardiaceae bacterium]
MVVPTSNKHDLRDSAGRALQTMDFFAFAQSCGFDKPWRLLDA